MTFLSFAFYFLLFLSTSVYLYLRQKFSYFSRKKIPFLKPKWILGNLSNEISIHESVMKVYEECKEKDVICGFYNSIQPIYFALDPKLINAVIVKDFGNFVNRGFYLNEEDEPITAHIFLLENDQWRSLRNKLTPAFTSGKLKSMFPIISQHTSTLLKVIEKKMENPIELRHISSQFTNDIISSVAFGMEANLLNDKNPELHKLFMSLTPFSDNILKFLMTMISPKLCKMLHVTFQEKESAKMFMEILKSNIKYREDSNDNRKDFLNMLIQLKNKGSIEGEFSKDTKKLKLIEIMAQCYFFFFAGADPASLTISWALAELSRNEEIQEKLRSEVVERTKGNGGEITYEAVMKMKYLKQVVDETLRLYPPATTIVRRAEKDYKIPNSTHLIPKGSSIWIPTIGLHYDEKYWPNPKKFDPERFTQEEIKKRPSFVYLPFGDGPRRCIGIRFASITVKLAIASVIKNFKLTLNQKTVYPFKFKLNAPGADNEGGFWINFEKI